MKPSPAARLAIAQEMELRGNPGRLVVQAEDCRGEVRQLETCRRVERMRGDCTDGDKIRLDKIRWRRLDQPLLFVWGAPCASASVASELAAHAHAPALLYRRPPPAAHRPL